jgi:hypothetical protein
MHSNASEGSVGDIQDEEFNRRGALKVREPQAFCFLFDVKVAESDPPVLFSNR